MAIKHVELEVAFQHVFLLFHTAVTDKLVLPPFLFISRWIVQNYTIQRLIKRNGGSNK
jgi:hypothetical protein